MAHKHQWTDRKESETKQIKNKVRSAMHSLAIDLQTVSHNERLYDAEKSSAGAAQVYWMQLLLEKQCLIYQLKVSIKEKLL